VAGEFEKKWPRLAGHVEILRVDHWVKNVFVIPGIVVGFVSSIHFDRGILFRLSVGMLGTCLIASSNYVLNELLDAPSDRLHPTKQFRPVARGQVSLSAAIVQWIALMIAGLALAAKVSTGLLATLGALWLMGCIYNIPPVRSKDLPYIDVLTESINNPLRMLAGWYMAGAVFVPPVSLLLSYWMLGCYFMAIKRFAELRESNGGVWIRAYRKSFRYYTEPRLLVSIAFYASASMLFLGAFMMRYRLELILCFPLIALVMAVYLGMAFDPNSAAQAPEKLAREPLLMISVLVCSIALVTMMFVDVPGLHKWFPPTMPTH
jgi:4-hydroxybenzoate polyprenyltransferase